MKEFQERFYRQYHNSKDLKSYKINLEESDLFIATTDDSRLIAMEALKRCRELIEKEIKSNNEFQTSYCPLKQQSLIPPLSWMYNAGILCDVGPMASVAGSVAQYVGLDLLKHNKEVIVENGGDIFIATETLRKVLVYAGESSISMKMAIIIEQGTWGICTSAGKVGPSHSFGNADAAIVISHDCALADAAATVLGNKIKSIDDLEISVKGILEIEGVFGVLAVIDDKIAAAGEIRLSGI